MVDYMLVSDAGPKGPVVTVLDKFYYDEDYVRHFDIKIFSKQTYEYFRMPRKLHSYALHLNTGESIPLGILCIVATELADFNWLLLDYNYSTLGVPGIAMPIGTVNAKIFPNC